MFVKRTLHFNGVLSSYMEEKSTHILKDEISSVLQKRAIQVESSFLSIQGFYSHYFVVP